MLPELFDPACSAWAVPRPPLDPALAEVEACLLDAPVPEGVDPELDPELEKTLFDVGLFSLTVPKVYGGLGASVVDFVRLMAILGRLGPEWAITAVPHLCISVATVAELAPPELARPIFQAIPQAHRLLAFAITEEAGSDVTAMRTRLLPDGQGGLILRGSKQWVTNLRRASHVVVAALCPGLHPMPGAAALVLVPTDAPGVHPTRPWGKLCANGSDTSDLMLDDLAVRPEWLLGRPGEAMKHFNEWVLPGRLGASAAALGVSRQALASWKGDAMTPLADLVEGALAAVLWAARLVDTRHPWCSHAVGLAKGLAGQVAQEVADHLHRASFRRGLPSPPAVQKARASMGLFRLLKGPGDLLALQAATALTSRVEGPSPGPLAAPEALRQAVAAFTTAVSDLNLRHHGRSQPVLMALGQAGGWLQALAALPPTLAPAPFLQRLQQSLQRARRLEEGPLLEELDAYYTACFITPFALV